MLFSRRTTKESRTHHSSLPAKAWIDMLSDGQNFLETCENIQSVVKLDEGPRGTKFEIVEVQPALLNLKTRFEALYNVLPTTSTDDFQIDPQSLDPSHLPGDIIRVETRAALSTRTVSIWNVVKDADAESEEVGGSIVTERNTYDTPWWTHALVGRQVEQTHNAAFPLYERVLETRQKGAASK